MGKRKGAALIPCIHCGFYTKPGKCEHCGANPKKKKEK